MRLIVLICLPLTLLMLGNESTGTVQAEALSGDCHAPVGKCVPLVAAPPKPAGPNWIFQPGLYSHDPRTGERTTQYAPLPAVEAFSDTRAIASGYHRSRVNQFGTGGSVDTYYRVENWGNGRGGIDAEWERVNDVWQQSTLSGGWGSGTGWPGGRGPGNGWNGGGWNGGGWNGGGWNGGGWNGGGWNGGPWQGGGGFPGGGGGPRGF